MISWGSNAVNSQLVTQPPSSAFFPLTMGAQYRGPGMWPRQGSYQVPPVIAGPASLPQISPNATGRVSNETGGVSMEGASGLFHPTRGTIVFAFIALAIGLFGLHYIHWGG